MKFRIHYEDDNIVIEGDSIENIQKIAIEEAKKRNWNIDKCWSEILI